jgi:hypothetical protein
MKRLCATGLTVLLCVHPLLADGSLARSASREASRLAAEPAGRIKPGGWSAVRQLEAITPLVVATPSQTAACSFVAADDDALTVLDLDVPGLAADVKRQLTAIARANPQALADAAHGGPKTIDTFRFGDDGVFLRDIRIATRAELIRRIPIDDVFTVTIAPRRRGIRAGDRLRSTRCCACGTVSGVWLRRGQFRSRVGSCHLQHRPSIRRRLWGVAGDQPRYRRGHLPPAVDRTTLIG